MPLIQTFGSASARGFGFLSLGDRYWIATLGGASNQEISFGIAIDSSGNCYVTGYDNTTNPTSLEVLITKYNASGVIQWQRVLGGVNNDQGQSIAVDSSGNCYVTGFTSSSGAGGQDVLITKYNTSGTIQWQRVLGGSSSDDGYGIAVDSSGNCYVTGSTDSTGAGNLDVLITKYNTSGTIQWQRVLGGSSSDAGYGIAVDSSGNCYVAGYTGSAGAGNNDVLLAKYDTSGTIQWQRVLGGSLSDIGNGIAVDSSGNCYVCGATNNAGAGGSDVLITKYNTSGTIQWQRVLGGSSGDNGYSIALDTSGNCYIAGYTNSAGAGGEVLILKIPGDGSKTGTYGIWTYQSSSLTAATSSLTASTSSLTAATSSLTDAASTLTDASSSLTSTVTYI